MKQIVLHPEAEAEIVEAAQFYEVNIPGFGSDFLGEVEQGLNQITEKPKPTSESEEECVGSHCGDSLTI